MHHCLNPTVPPLKPNTHGLRPRGHSYELLEYRLQLCNVLSGVYTDTHDDDGAVLHYFCFIILCNSCISYPLHVRLLHVLNRRLKIRCTSAMSEEQTERHRRASTIVKGSSLKDLHGSWSNRRNVQKKDQLSSVSAGPS